MNIIIVSKFDELREMQGVALLNAFPSANIKFADTAEGGLTLCAQSKPALLVTGSIFDVFGDNFKRGTGTQLANIAKQMHPKLLAVLITADIRVDGEARETFDAVIHKDETPDAGIAALLRAVHGFIAGGVL